MRFTLMILLATAPHLDDCNPTPEQCAKAAVAVHLEELKCGEEAPILADKANNPTCQRAIEWRAAYESKCQ
jgi:hypothetical protein